MGKQYIIEIPEDKIADFVGSTHFLMPYMMAGHIGHHDTGLPIEPYTEPDLEQVRKEAYEKGFDAGMMLNMGKYEKGINDAWDAARTLWNTVKREEIFGYTVFNTAIMALTGQEAIEKIRQYEQERDAEIKVGDEVEGDEDGQRGVVIDSRFENSQVAVLTGNSKVYSWWSKCAIHKTGRHFPEIAEVLAKMREE